MNLEVHNFEEIPSSIHIYASNDDLSDLSQTNQRNDELPEGLKAIEISGDLGNDFFNIDSVSNSPTLTPLLSLSPSYVRTAHFFPQPMTHNSVVLSNTNDQEAQDSVDTMDTLSTLSDLSYTSGTGSYPGEWENPFYSGSELLMSALDQLGTKQKKLSRRMERRKRKLRSKRTGKEIPIEFKDEYDSKEDSKLSSSLKRLSKSPSSTTNSQENSFGKRKSILKKDGESSLRFSIMTESSPSSPTKNSTIEFNQHSHSNSNMKKKVKKNIASIPRRKPISNKKLMKLIPSIECETIEGSTTAIYVGPDMTTHKYHITREQLLLILQKKSEERLLRMERAKQYANRLNRFSARYGCNGEINGKTVVTYTSEKIKSILLTWVLKHRFQKARKSAIKIQRWYRKMRVVKKEEEIKQEIVVQIQVEEEVREEEAIQQLKYQVLVQRHFRTYVEMIHVIELLKEKYSVIVQKSLRSIFPKIEIQSMLNNVLFVQSNIRRELVCEDLSGRIQERISEMKQIIHQEYHRTNAPYPRRALFFYSMKDSGTSEFMECSNELKILKEIKVFMTEKDFKAHKEEIFNKLRKYENDPNLIGILNKVFTPQIKHKENESNNYNSTTFEGLLVAPPPELHYVSKINQIPFHYVLKELVNVMFNAEIPIDKINWSSIIIIHYFLSNGEA